MNQCKNILITAFFVNFFKLHCYPKDRKKYFEKYSLKYLLKAEISNRYISS